MDIENRPHNREDQTELPEPVKVRLTGRLRGRINERAGDYDHDKVRFASMHRAYGRQKTNIVVETEEEAYAVVRDIDHYATPGIDWMRGPMLAAAQRVERELHEGLQAGGVDSDSWRI